MSQDMNFSVRDCHRAVWLDAGSNRAGPGKLNGPGGEGACDLHQACP